MSSRYNAKMHFAHTKEAPEKLPVDGATYGPEKVTTSSYDEDFPSPSPQQITERKFMTKIDLHVMPFLCIMYLLAFLDRINIGNASVFGLLDDLHMTSSRFNTALAIFFAPYCVFEISSNILLKQFKPHVWLSLNMFLFGFVTIMQGLVQNWAGLLTTRFFLGLFETGIFILEGALTVAVSFVLFFLLPDFPEEAKWLSEEERAFLRIRLRTEKGASARDRPITLKDITGVFKDHKILGAGFMYCGLIVPAYGFAYFAPRIIQAFGDYSAVETQLHTVPPRAAAFVFCMLTAAISDRARHRFGFAIFSICSSITGFAILISVHDLISLQYGALFLVTMGTYTAMPIVICWFNMNLGGHHKRSVGSAWQIGFGNTGGIIATLAFLSQDAPKFVTGYSICLAFTALSICACVTYAASCLMVNRKWNKGTANGVLTE